MTIKLITRDKTGEMLLDGRLDSVTAPETETLLMEAAGRFDHVVLNFEKLTYISSAGLRVLRKAHMTMIKKGGTLTLRNVNSMIMEVFEMTGFVCLLNIE